MSSLTITIIQDQLVWEDAAANRHHFQQLIYGLPATQVVVLPEMFSTGFSMQAASLAETMNGVTVEWMKNLALQKKIILTGSLIIEENGKYYNRMLWVLPNGRVEFYDKRHLFAFAGEDVHYEAGKERVIVSVNGWRILLQVCYDLRFPVFARQQVNDEHAEYDAIIYVANWPNKRNHAWKTLLQARAIENQCFVIGVNRVGTDAKGHAYSGDSMIVNAMGEILHTEANTAFTFTTTLHKEELDALRNNLPFLRDADQFSILP